MPVSERARCKLGTWPSPVSLVDELLALAPTRSSSRGGTRLRAAADGLAGMARDMAIAVVAKRIGDV